MDVLKISLICILSGLSIVYFFVLIMFHSDMRVINRKRFNNFNERRIIGVGSEVFLTFEEFMNYYSLAPDKDEKLKKQKETAEFLNYVQDDINALRKQSVNEMRVATDSMQQIITQQNTEKSLEDFLNKDEKFFENEF